MKMISLKLFVATVFFAVLSGCGGADTKSSGKKDNYETAKEDLGETEKKNPVRFLTVASHDKKNLLGQTVIKGTIVNNATVASYKDVEVELNFYSKTGTLLEKDVEIIYETIAAGKETDFKTKYFAPKGTDSVVLKVIKAKGE